MYVEVKDLSSAVRSALTSVGYGARDIKVEAAEQVGSYSAGSEGQRGFLIIVNLDTGERHRSTGSWGGSNMFVRSAVDDSDESIHIPPNGAVIKGTIGYPRTYAVIYTPALGRFLPSGEQEELTDEQQQTIYCHTAIKGGEYRREEMRRRHVSQAAVDSLVERGYLKRNKAGAVQATTKGKNARTVRY